MRDDALLADVDQDLQLSARARVVYLEGDSDPEVFFALLGVAMPPAVMPGRFAHEGVLVTTMKTTRDASSTALFMLPSVVDVVAPCINPDATAEPRRATAPGS